VRSTLFYIPHADPIWGIPVFGVGWLLGLLVIGGLITLVVRARHQDWREELWRELPVFLLLGAAIVWGAPMVEQRTTAGTPLGIPIRGYGLMVLLGIVLSVALLVRESRRVGLHPDLVLSLAFWMVVSGFLGARLFYVIEYWSQFSAASWGATLANILKLTDGGLVVYGAFLGSSASVVIFTWRHRLPLLGIADLLAPCMMLGLALGRIGCFLNGCCWGGVCADSHLGISFPPGSPPFIDQLESGSLLDVHLERHPDGTYRVVHVQRPGLGDRAGLQPGDEILQLRLPDSTALNRMRHGETVPDALVSVMLEDGRRISWRMDQLPERSRPVYPSQILSSINAALICLLLWSYYPLRRRDGEVAAMLATIYPINRILLEMIRADESGLFAIDFRMTISQTLSIIFLVCVAALWAYVLTRPRGTALPARHQPA